MPQKSPAVHGPDRHRRAPPPLPHRTLPAPVGLPMRAAAPAGQETRLPEHRRWHDSCPLCAGESRTPGHIIVRRAMPRREAVPLWGGAARCPALGIYSRRWWPRSGWRIAPGRGVLRHQGCCSWAVRRVNVSASAVSVSGRPRRREKVSLVDHGRGVSRRHLTSAEGAHRFGPGGVSACVGSSGPVCSSVVAPR